jgi:hypothetical protein
MHDLHRQFSGPVKIDDSVLVDNIKTLNSIIVCFYKKIENVRTDRLFKEINIIKNHIHKIEKSISSKSSKKKQKKEENIFVSIVDNPTLQ